MEFVFSFLYVKLDQNSIFTSKVKTRVKTSFNFIEFLLQWYLYSFYKISINVYIYIYHNNEGKW